MGGLMTWWEAGWLAFVAGLWALVALLALELALTWRDRRRGR